MIRLDGASQGGFLHKLGEVAPDDVAIGMAVEAVWRPLEERTGSILDIAYFRPRGRWRLMARTVSGELPVAFHYTPGVGNTAFFEALRDRGVLLGIAMRGVRGHVPACTDLLRTMLRGADRRHRSAVRAGRSSRSRSATSASTASRWTNRRRSGSSGSTTPTRS